MTLSIWLATSNAAYNTTAYTSHTISLLYCCPRRSFLIQLMYFQQIQFCDY